MLKSQLLIVHTQYWEVVAQGVKPLQSNIWTVGVVGSSPTAGSE